MAVHRRGGHLEGMTKMLKIYLLAYPDNPVGNVFIRTFLSRGIPIAGVIVETKTTKGNWKRLNKKIQKDGFFTAFKRMGDVYVLRIFKQNIVALARKNRIDVQCVDKFNSRASENLLKTLDIDQFAIVSAPILKDYVFTKAKKGCLNAHPGWLPKYRGLGGNAYAIQNGDAPGITVHFIDTDIDKGKILVREKVKIRPGDTVSKINDRAMARGAELMADVITQLAEGTLKKPTIDESAGDMYYAMPFASVKKLNKKLRDVEFIQNLN